MLLAYPLHQSEAQPRHARCQTDERTKVDLAAQVSAYPTESESDEDWWCSTASNSVPGGRSFAFQQRPLQAGSSAPLRLGASSPPEAT